MNYILYCIVILLGEILYKKIFKDRNIFEILFLFISLITITIYFILRGEKNILSLIGVITVLCASKWLVITPMINILYDIIYTLLSFSQKYYGELIIFIFWLIPINIATIISWFKNRSKDNKNIVTINKITKKEYLYLGITTVFSTTGFYFYLKF